MLSANVLMAASSGHAAPAVVAQLADAKAIATPQQNVVLRISRLPSRIRDIIPVPVNAKMRTGRRLLPTCNPNQDELPAFQEGRHDG
jgi:hypothetical protein